MGKWELLTEAVSGSEQRPSHAVEPPLDHTRLPGEHHVEGTARLVRVRVRARVRVRTLAPTLS